MEQSSLENNEQEQGCTLTETKRFNLPRTEIKKGKLTINDTVIEEIAHVDGVYVSEDGESIAAYTQPSFQNNKEKEDAELKDAHGYRSGVYPGRKTYVLGYEGEDTEKLIIKSEEEDCVIDERTSFKTKHIIGSKDFLDEEKNSQRIPYIDGVSYENLRGGRVNEDGSNEKLLQVMLGEGKTLLVNPNSPAENIAIQRQEGKAPKINGVEWNSLDRKDIYMGGYRVAVDFKNKKTMFCTSTEDRNTGKHAYGYVVNNRPWNFSDKNYSQFGVENGLAYVATNETLYIDDKKWNESPIFTKTGEREVDKNSNITHTAIGEKGGKIAVANRFNKDGKWLNEIIEGDIHGPSKKWNNQIAIEKMIADKEMVVVAGKNTKDECVIVINDVLVKPKDDIAEFLSLKIEEREVLVKYKTAMGEVVENKVQLTENAQEHEKTRVEKEKQEEALHTLINLCFTEGLSPQELVNRMQQTSAENTKNKEEVEKQNRIIRSYEVDNQNLKNEVSDLKENNKKFERDLEDKKNDISVKLRNITNLLEKAKEKKGGIFGGETSFNISAEEMKSLKDYTKETK